MLLRSGRVYVLRCTLSLTFVVLLLTWMVSHSYGQSTRLQAGFGAWPGVGVQAGYVQQYNMYSLEIVVSAETSPWHTDIPLFISTGFGSTLRPTGILREIGRADYDYDLDLGIRLGPGLFFIQNASRTDQNRQFNLFIDLFIRYSRNLEHLGIGYVEFGTQRPRIRVGVLHSL